MRTTLIALALATSTLSIACHPAAHGEDAAMVDDLHAHDASVAERVAPDAREDAPSARAFEHGAVLHEGGDWLVLGAREDDPSEGDFHELETDSGNQALTRALRASATQEISTPIAVRVYRGDAWVCDANVRATPVVLAVVDPGFDDEGARAHKPLDEVWTTGLRAIAARLSATRGDCARGEWAQRIDRPAPSFALEQRPSNAVVDAALLALRSSDAGREIQARHAAQCADERLCDRAWLDRPDVARTVKLWTLPDGRRVVYAAVHSAEGCGGFDAELAIIAEITERSGAIVLTNPTLTSEPSFDPTVLLERVEDGRRVLEWRFATDRLTLDAARGWTFERVTIPYFGCPC